MPFTKIGAVVLCLAAGAASADAQQADQRKQPVQTQATAGGKAATEPREMKTLQLGNGSYIRYEVLPDDDQQPPGQLVVMHFDASNAAPAAAEAERMRLAARLLELRGVQVDHDVALWIQRNSYFTGDGVPAVQVFADPLFFSAMQSDSTARALATDLAHCEGTAQKG